MRQLKVGNAQLGLIDNTIERLIEVISQNKRVQEIFIYGSRAKGSFKKYSDIDITLRGEELIHTDLFQILNDIDELNLPYEIDLSLLKEIDNPALLEDIKSEGVSIWKRGK